MDWLVHGISFEARTSWRETGRSQEVHRWKKSFLAKRMCSFFVPSGEVSDFCVLQPTTTMLVNRSGVVASAGIYLFAQAKMLNSDWERWKNNGCQDGCLW